MYTGLYKHYLGCELLSEKLYQDAVSLTNKLKEREIESRLKTTRTRRAMTDQTLGQKEPGQNQQHTGVNFYRGGSGGDNNQHKMNGLGSRIQKRKAKYAFSWPFHKRAKDINDEEIGHN